MPSKPVPKSSKTPAKKGKRNEMARRRLRVNFDDGDTSSANEMATDGDEGPPLLKLPFLQTPLGSKKVANAHALKSPSSAKKRKRLAKYMGSGSGAAGKSESFIMKLFDRSLDLSVFTEKTPLYPICRAWMANKPRSLNARNTAAQVLVKREENGMEMYDRLIRGWVDVYAMPKVQSESKFEEMLKRQKKQKRETDDDDEEASENEEEAPENDRKAKDVKKESTTSKDEEMEEDSSDESQEEAKEKKAPPKKKEWEALIGSDQTREELLADLKGKWTASRKLGQLNTHRRYHQRYDTNRKIIQLMYIRTSALKQSALHQNRS